MAQAPLPKTSRTKRVGQINYETRALREMAHALGISPMQTLLQFAQGYVVDIDPVTKEKTFRKVDDNLRFAGAKECAKYLYPLIRQVEFHGPGGGPVQVAHSFAQLVQEAVSGHSGPLIEADEVDELDEAYEPAGALCGFDDSSDVRNLAPAPDYTKQELDEVHSEGE